MPPSLVELEVVLDRLGIAQATTDADAVARLLDGVCAEIRRRSRRGFEGDEGADYTETYRLEAGQRDLTLLHAPVASIASITRQWFDGTDAWVYAASDYRIEDAATARVRIWPSSWDRSARSAPPPLPDEAPFYVEVAYHVTGEVTSDVAVAAEDWVCARWQDRPRRGLTAYKTGEDSEAYGEASVGQPPRDVARMLASYFHPTAGGPV